MVSSHGDPFSLRCSSCTVRKLALGLAVVAVAACILLWVLLILLITKKARARYRDSSSSPPDLALPCRFTVTDLRPASLVEQKGKFDDSRSRLVYTGILPDGSVVSIRKLPHEGLIKEQAFTSQIEVISRVRHQNLLRLLGFCYENGEARLVYEYMPFSLHHFLFGSFNQSSVRCSNGEAGPSWSLNGISNAKDSIIEVGCPNGDATNAGCADGEPGFSKVLNGEARLRVLKGIGAALVHLHENRILHRDVNVGNVMLTEDLEPRLGDFGVARLMTLKHDNKSPPSYIAPEVAYTGKATEKADVYSYGVLALEVASGRRALDGQFHLLEWVWMLHLSNKLMEALDPLCMQGNDNETSSSGISLSADMELQWKCVLHVALLCCHPLLEARPTMRQAAMVIQEAVLMPLPTSMPNLPNPK